MQLAKSQYIYKYIKFYVIQIFPFNYALTSSKLSGISCFISMNSGTAEDVTKDVLLLEAITSIYAKTFKSNNNKISVSDDHMQWLPVYNSIQNPTISITGNKKRYNYVQLDSITIKIET